MRQRIALPSAALQAAYHNGQTTVALARLYGCSPTTIAKQLRASGVALRRSRFAPIALDAGLLRKAYLDERLPIAAIAARFGVSPGTIGNRRRALGIPNRPRAGRRLA